MSNVLSVSSVHGWRRGAAIAALCLAACGADPGKGPAGDPGPLPANPPATTETAPSLSLVLDELLPGWTVTTTRQTGSDAPQQETLAPAEALTLSGTASDVFSAMINDERGQVVGTASMAARCGHPRARTLVVPAAYTTIQAAVDAARPGDSVLVAPGVYTEFVTLRPGVCLRGSGAGRTILDAKGAGLHLLDLSLAPGSAVSGFTLRGVGPAADDCMNLGPFACGGEHYGSALYLEGQRWRDPLQDAPPLISNNVFEGNQIGMMMSSRGMAVVRNNLFVNNRYGLLSSHFHSRALVANNVFWKNQEMAISNHAASLDILNNVIVSSSVGIFFEYVQTGWIRCNQFFEVAWPQKDANYVPPRFTLGQDGNVRIDPRFVDPANGDFRLRPDAPGRGAGCYAGRVRNSDGSDEDVGAYGGPLGGW